MVLLKGEGSFTDRNLMVFVRSGHTNKSGTTQFADVQLDARDRLAPGQDNLHLLAAKQYLTGDGKATVYATSPTVERDGTAKLTPEGTPIPATTTLTQGDKTVPAAQNQPLTFEKNGQQVQSYQHEAAYSSQKQFSKIREAAGQNVAPWMDQQGNQVGQVYGVKASIMTQSKGPGLVIATNKPISTSDFKVDQPAIDAQYKAPQAAKAAKEAQAATQAQAPQAEQPQLPAEPAVAEQQPAIG